jgi:hypothetical protein
MYVNHLSDTFCSLEKRAAIDRRRRPTRHLLPRNSVGIHITLADMGIGCYRTRCGRSWTSRQLHALNDIVILGPSHGGSIVAAILHLWRTLVGMCGTSGKGEHGSDNDETEDQDGHSQQPTTLGYLLLVSHTKILNQALQLAVFIVERFHDVPTQIHQVHFARTPIC